MNTDLEKPIPFLNDRLETERQAGGLALNLLSRLRPGDYLQLEWVDKAITLNIKVSREAESPQREGPKA